MLGLPLAFSSPFVLMALVGLPALWYVLRVTPPRPQNIAFPPLRLILDLRPQDETAARTPWWLLALRLALAAFIIVAMAGPVWNPLPASNAGQGPLLVVMDDGWPSAPTWERRVAAAHERIQSASLAGRVSALVLLSENGREIVASDGARMIERLRALKPVPYVADRAVLLQAIRRYVSANHPSDIVWIADGLEFGATRDFTARNFAQGLADVAATTATKIQVLTLDRTPLAIARADNSSGALDVTLVRADTQGRATGRVRALDLKGQRMAAANFDFGTKLDAHALIDLPLELRNEVARLDIEDEQSAGAVSLLDERWKRRRVGLVSGETTDTAQPLLAASYYLTKALAPFADVREMRPGQTNGQTTPIESVLGDGVSVMVLADVGTVTGVAHDKLAAFVEEGGVLVRFAGGRLAASVDDLVPVRLRRGGRVLGGSLSWESPKQLAPFEKDSPFFGLAVPDEVSVTRQVLAEPDAGLRAKTWATLVDGTPLVTAEQRGKGLVVLVHVTADTTWSNLPLSGLFVDMLRRVVAMSHDPAAIVSDGAMSDTSETPVREGALVPTRTLDGFGALGAPPVTATSIAANFDGPVSADHPPGFYGPADAPKALNTLQPDERLKLMDLKGLSLNVEKMTNAEPKDMRAALISLAVVLMVLDALATLWLSGGLRFKARHMTASLLVFAALGLSVPDCVRAAEAPALNARDLDAVLHTHLAYVMTGDAQVDEASKLGLAALSRAIAARTSLNPGEPNGVDPARDELSFYPIIYWPIVTGRPQPPAQAVTRLSNFMKQGGTVLFDTRDALTAREGSVTPEAQWLRRLLADVDVPELEIVPRDHVVTKTFYLIDTFVGRTTNGQTWIEALPPAPLDAGPRPARAGDSVSPIIITSNDLAAAWAVNRNGAPLYPLSPGGNRQREMALRGGINFVIYTLTGNYKADQVHVRDLLERLAH